MIEMAYADIKDKLQQSHGWPEYVEKNFKDFKMSYRFVDLVSDRYVICGIYGTHIPSGYRQNVNDRIAITGRKGEEEILKALAERLNAGDFSREAEFAIWKEYMIDINKNGFGADDLLFFLNSLKA